MKRLRLSWQIKLALYLIALSIFLHITYYLIFRDSEGIFSGSFAKIAFLPIQVVVITLIIQELLTQRSKRKKLKKLNLIIGAFFSEIGTELLTYLSDSDPKLDEIRKYLIVTDDWAEQEFSRVSRRLRNYEYGVDIKKVDLKDLRKFLREKQNFLLRLLENPILLEHESFTELLRAIFHLSDELTARKDLRKLPDTDYEHLAGDIKRAYTLLAHEWLDYMKYLKGAHPYLFSLSMRTNPFDQDASPIVK